MREDILVVAVAVFVLWLLRRADAKEISALRAGLVDLQQKVNAMVEKQR